MECLGPASQTTPWFLVWSTDYKVVVHLLCMPVLVHPLYHSLLTIPYNSRDTVEIVPIFEEIR